MKFEEALELLKQGKKLRRSCWTNSYKKYLYLENNEFWLTTNEIAGIIGIHYDNIVANDWEEYEEPLLTEEEKEYLQMNIEFHPEEITSVNVRFHNHFNVVYLQYEPNGFDYCMVNKNYFKNLEEKKEYTLEELGLEEEYEL